MTPRRRIPISPVPRIYCASSITRASMWREWQKELKPNVEIVSTWHLSETLVADDMNEAIASLGWRTNMTEIASCEHLLAYAEADDPINGTLVEIGAAIVHLKDVHLVGTYKWGSWRHLSFIYTHKTLHDALMDITKTRSHGYDRRSETTQD
jgi:hypothetical protein